MEKHFSNRAKSAPAVHVGSQTMKLYHNDPSEQAYEGFHLAFAHPDDVVVMRNLDPDYLVYWNRLMGHTKIVNITDVDTGEYLSNILLSRPDLIEEITSKMHPEASLKIYLPTHLEEKLASALGIPLHGNPKITQYFGTKSGIRQLAEKAHIQMAPGVICRSLSEIQTGMRKLFDQGYSHVVVKHDLSSAGKWMKRFHKGEVMDLHTLDLIANGEFQEGRDIVVVEAWLKNTASLCAQIEIEKNKEPQIRAAWQQILDVDGVSYMGAGPLMLSEKALESFKTQLFKLAYALKKEGAVGSYGPDFLIIGEGEHELDPDTCVLLELNARIPVTAFPLEIIHQIKGEIGTGFYVTEIRLDKHYTVEDILNKLKEKKLLITEKNSHARGVVPYNMSILPWGHFYVVVMGKDWEDIQPLISQVKGLFKSHQHHESVALTL